MVKQNKAQSLDIFFCVRVINLLHYISSVIARRELRAEKYTNRNRFDSSEVQI